MATRELKRMQKNLGEMCAGRQEEVAEGAGISRVHLSRIIHGRANPSVDLAVRLAQVLDTSLDALISKKS